MAMNALPGWLAAAVALALLLGLVLLLGGRGMRRRRGLGGGKTISLDQVTLTSRRYEMTGRPDRLIRDRGTIIPEEWKSARSCRPWHHAQMGVYFLLIEDQLRVRPERGYLVCGDGSRHRIENSPELRDWVLGGGRESRG
jgi:CRISPR-associated exonuclease Cas4